VAGGVRALDLIPSTSRGFTEARRLRAEALYSSADGLPALAAAMSSLDGVQLGTREQGELTAQILSRALTLVDRDGPREDVRIGGYGARPEELRDGLETTYRQLAGVETDQQRRWALVDQANAVRRWTLR
jgi:serine/threonine-protein kinase PknG